MSWKSLAAPLAVIVVGVVIIVLVLTTPDRRPSTGAGDQGVALQQDQPCSAYPANAQPERCLTPTAYPGQSTATVTSATPETATTTETTTTTATTITPETTSAAVITAQPTVPTTPPEDAVTPEAPGSEVPGSEVTTPEATPVSVLTCAPGERIEITGQGPPRAPFLLSFGQRVVGGGSVSITGNFSIPLVVGRERPGNYLVTVRVRGSEQVLRELTCAVPAAAAPTPIKSG